MWGIDSLCISRKRKRTHHGFMVKMGVWDTGDLSCLLGYATGLLQSLWLVLFSSRTSTKEEYYVFFYLSAAKEGGKGFVNLSPLCCSMTGMLGYLDCKILETFWLVGRMERSPMDLWVPGLCGEHLEREAGSLKGKTLKLKKVFRFQDHALLQDLPSPRVFVTSTITALLRLPEQSNNNYPRKICHNDMMKHLSRQS